MSTLPPLLRGLVDDAAVFPPGSATLPDALAAHRRHREAWYADLVGPLLVPASALTDLAALLDPAATIDVGVIGDVPIGDLAALLAGADPRLRIRQLEAAVARRGEDPQPGLHALAALAADLPAAADLPVSADLPADRPVFAAPALPAERPVYAELPLTRGLPEALETLARLRADGLPIAAKFRTGGLAAELFPSPAQLAAVIAACRDHRLPFKLTAGLHHALRHTDPATGFTHHGFVNVLAAVLAAADGATIEEITRLLAAWDAETPAALVGAATGRDRPLWIGFGSCSVTEPLDDLAGLGFTGTGTGTDASRAAGPTRPTHPAGTNDSEERS